MVQYMDKSNVPYEVKHGFGKDEISKRHKTSGSMESKKDSSELQKVLTIIERHLVEN
ncbi:hypothetical protein Smp_142200 [Schistosoma mansoni]|uniref:hypothetical protein n=1 Tax=Schistosoma mansoni TaxID=6183 RepID=UPI0001A634A0|nr:hypothetical protein Smp_142200 [Schistosoma mansoni]|eukprot:XP_018654238.1 hypothetical protein Smp_142200 [Schistosoma mansoni]